MIWPEAPWFSTIWGQEVFFMKSRLVKDLMVPLEEYATVSEDASLYEAILALERTHLEVDQSHYRHRAVLVFDSQNRVIGKLGQFDIFMALEAKYSELELGDPERFSRLGLSPQFVRSIQQQFSFWSEPLEEICRKAVDLEVKDIMHILTEGEYIDENASLDEAIHHLIMGQHQSLIVSRDNEIIGILKLSDIFREVSLLIQQHDVED
jgi:CBS domain-containing protein